MPFYHYSIDRTCGPFEWICRKFDFSSLFLTVNKENIVEIADLMMEQYSRTASLFPHNVALIPVGDDFRLREEFEYNYQYQNYKIIIDFINTNSATRYNKATISFGTPIDYFRAIEERQQHKFPTLVGDFFPYADILYGIPPSYWTGYFTTRPFYKLMSRDLEHNLRSMEILFTLALNKARQNDQNEAYANFEKNYVKIIQVRYNESQDM